MYTHKHTHIYTYMYIHTQTYIHIPTYACKCNCNSTVKFLQCKQFYLALFYFLKHSLWFKELKQFFYSSFSQKTKTLYVY